jgi:nitrogen fixation-related uncharacterized protein
MMVVIVIMIVVVMAVVMLVVFVVSFFLAVRRGGYDDGPLGRRLAYHDRPPSRDTAANCGRHGKGHQLRCDHG